MIKLWIDHKEVSVPEGMSLLHAARKAGAEVPSMCFLEGHKNHPSCMVCLVKDVATDQLLPSCAHPAMEGMEILSDTEEVRQARREALELLLSDHVGDCEAPCRRACPAFMDIPLMNRHIASGKHHEALQVVKEEIALPHILGYICPAPCEKVCRRNQVDSTVAICQLKKFVAARDVANNKPFLPKKKNKSGKKAAIIGAGPAGLACAFYLLKHGHQCVLFDKNEKAGGSLRYAQLDNELPEEVLESEIRIIAEYGAEFRLNAEISNKVLANDIKKEFDAVILATGAQDENSNIHTNDDGFGLERTANGIKTNPETLETSEQGVFTCGSAIKSYKMAVRAVAQGKTAAWSAHQYLMGKDSIKSIEKQFDSKFGKLTQDEVIQYLKEASGDRQVQPGQGKLNGFSEEEAVKEADRCLHCDCRKPNSCKLRLYATEYQADRKKFLLGTRKTIIKYHQHAQLVYEPEKCIKCGLCVDITSEHKELTGLTYIGRGFDIRINVPFERPIEEALTITAGECVRACPTGALSFKTDSDNKTE